MVTIADVAKRAGVSMMTVSRVINKRDHVRAETRKRVERVIDELDYRPNMVARSLATKRNQTIAYVVSNLANPFFPKVNKGVQTLAVEHGYTTIVYDISNSRELDDCINMLIDRRIAGVIFHHLDIRQEHLDRLFDNQVCCVTIDNECDVDGVTQIESDDYQGARMAVRYLLDKGHRRIGCIHGRFDHAPLPDYEGIEYTETFQRRIWQNRTQGCLAELRAHGLEPACMLEGRGSSHYSMIMGSVNMFDLFHSGDIPTALYCENDLMALGALGECLRLGVRVPDDVAILGHDGLDISMVLFPRITTVQQPMHEMGMLAAERLIDTIENKSEPKHIFTYSTLFVGDTT